MTTRRALGVDLGGTNLRVACVEIDGDEARIVEQGRRAIAADRDPERVVALLINLIDEVAPGAQLPVGIGIAGMLHGVGGVVANAPNLGWRDVPFATLAATALGRPVWVENDLGAIAWGEHRFGAAQGFRHAVCVFVGTGVGGGAVLNSRPYRGAGNASLEVGHVKVVAHDGRRCGCGQRGCLEAYAGGRALAEQARSMASPQLLALVDGDRSRLHAGHLDEAARRGCASSDEILGRAGTYLGGVLASLATLFNPSCLLIGGTVWTGCSRLRDAASVALEAQVTSVARPWMELREARLGDDAGVLGAADLALVEGIGA